MLKGKCKTDFEEWYNHKYYNSAYSITFSLTQTQYERGSERPMDVTMDIGFDELPQTMQQGVLLEFFMERGYFFSIREYNFTDDNKTYYAVWTKNHKLANVLGCNKKGTSNLFFPDYSTAFTTAIDKACEIVNGGVK